MGISLQQYRAKIGLHITKCVSMLDWSDISEKFLSSITDSTLSFVRAVGNCITYIFLFVWLLMFILTTSQVKLHEHYTSPTHLSSPVHLYQQSDLFCHSRIIISAILYCCIKGIQSIHPKSLNICTKNAKLLFKKQFCMLFRNKGLSHRIIVIYSMWLVSLNGILIAMTIPNLTNPGPSTTKQNIRKNTRLTNLNVLYQNINGFVNLKGNSSSPKLSTSKVLEFQGFLYSEKPDIVILNETWLKNQILDGEIFPNNTYKVFRRDRSLLSHPLDRKNPKKFRVGGGGVLIAVRSDLDAACSVHSIKGNSAKAEIISVTVAPGTGRNICFSTLYRVGTLGAENLNEVKRHLTSISSSKSMGRHILVGDINLSKTQWPSGNTSCTTEQGFVDMFYDFDLKQLINNPTHVCGNTLDLLLSNCPDLLTDIEILNMDSVCKSDHYGIKFKVKYCCKRLKSRKRKIYNFKKANFSAINADLRKIDWESLLNEDEDINCTLHKFNSTLKSICDRYIPIVTIKSDFQPPWFDSELDSICKAKNKLLDKYKSTKDAKIYEEIKKIRKRFRKTCEKKKRDNVFNDDDPALIKKKFWSYLKSTSNSTRIPETVSYKGRFRSIAKDKGDLFNKFFSDQFSNPSDYNININLENDPNINTVLRESDVYNFARKLNANKAAGPDNIHGKIIKLCARGLAKPLSILYNRCFHEGKIPKLWKLGSVVPVFKKGDKSSVENYRPISLTCLPMKIFEYCMRDLLMSKCSNLIDPRQHGFLPHKSCTTQMIPFTSELASILNNSSRIDVIFFDFAKAFDSVNHDIILRKLKEFYNVDGLLLQFIKNYLENREQHVLINGEASNFLPVHSGVPQGSILGPLLFVLFINDMHKVISTDTSIALYADDTRICREILCEEDQSILQKDINSLYNWSIVNKMKFHPNKCKVLAVTNKLLTYHLPFYEFLYMLNDTPLDYVESETDLGVIINGKLNWSAHCRNIASKANKRLGLIRRICHFTMCSEQRRVLYLTLVRSIFEHCSPIWSPQTIGNLNLFDQIQRRGVKWILKEPFVSYSDSEFLAKQHRLDLLPMKYKFLHTDLALFHNIVHEAVNITMPKYIIKMGPSDFPRVTRSNRSVAENVDKFKYKCTTRTRTNSFGNSFFVRTLKEWNDLPLSFREVTDNAKFKFLLKQHMWNLLGLKPMPD